MNTPARLGVYLVGLVAAFGVAAGVGAAAGPIDVGGDDHDAGHAGADTTGVSDTSAPHEGSHEGAADTTTATAPSTEPASGLRLDTSVASTAAGAPFDYRFTVDGGTGPIVDFDELHERRLHLIVVSGDLVDFWHVHPEMNPDGEWHIQMPALQAGVYTVYADFRPTGGEQTTLQQRITVTAGDGAAAPRALPAPSTVASVAGFEVQLSGSPVPGDSTLQFDVTRDGRPVATEPYLGAAGHLVAIRASDGDYLHVHPLDGGAPSVRFAADLPTAGTYRLFLDFAVDGPDGSQVHTASFTLEVPAADVDVTATTTATGSTTTTAPATTAAPAGDAHEGHGS